MWGFFSDLLKRKSGLGDKLTHYQFDNAYFYSLGKAVWSERDYQAFASEAYIKNVIAYRAITMIAQSAASVPVRLFRGSQHKRVPVENHPLLQILQRPNPLYSGREMLEQIYSYRLISGNAYILAVGPDGQAPCELVTLRPDRVTILAGLNFTPCGYRYTIDNRHTDYYAQVDTGKCNILHIKNFHPLSDWYGLSAIEAAAYSIDQHNQAGAWNQALLQNGARPSGAMVLRGNDGKPGHMNEEQFQRLKNMVDEMFTGPANAGRPMLLEGGLEWQEMSMSPRDMDFLNSKHSAARDVALAFGMPPQLLGIPGDNTYSNLAEARIALWEQTVLPLVDNTIEALNHWLVPYFESDLQLTCDVEGVQALSSKREALWDKVQNANFMTINEKRSVMGLPPLQGGENLNMVL